MRNILPHQVERWIEVQKELKSLQEGSPLVRKWIGLLEEESKLFKDWKVRKYANTGSTEFGDGDEWDPERMKYYRKGKTETEMFKEFLKEREGRK